VSITPLRSPVAGRASHSLSASKAVGMGVGGGGGLAHSSATESHMEEMIRIHRLWSETKEELRAMTRARDALVREFEEDSARRDGDHQKQTITLVTEIDALKAERRARDEALSLARKEHDALSRLSSDLQQQLATTHEKYAEQMTQTAAVTNRLREVTDQVNDLRRINARNEDRLKQLEVAENSLNITREEIGIRER
jgi:chromosome segregation ATPase